MRNLVVQTMVTLDGVMQAPGGPEEDPSGGFAHGGWSVPYFDEVLGQIVGEAMSKPFDLVLGRRTYEIFAAYWPYQSGDDPTARSLNAARKHVASRTLASVDWNNSSLLEGDAATAIAALKRTPGPDLQIIGSGGLIQALQAAALIDEFNVWTFPVVLGRGKRLFESSAAPGALRLESSSVSGTGVVMSRYVPDGAVRTGTFETIAPSAPELARRERMARGEF